MANIIRIRALEQEKNLNDIIFPVDKNIYGSNAKRISIFDLKTWILSGFTGGGTSCTGITSNVIRIIVTGTTTSTSTSTSTSTTTSTTTTTPAPTIPQIYFNSNGSGSLAINNPGVKTYTITFSYIITADCDNVGTDGQDPNQATTTFDISTNGGLNWTTIDSVTAVVSGGNYPNGQSDSQQKTGTITLNNITSANVPNIKVGGGYNCSVGQNGQSGDITATIATVVPNIGIANIICNNIYNSNCSSTYVSCTGTTTSTTTTTMVPYYTYNFNKTCSSVSGNFVFERIDIPQVLVNTIVTDAQSTLQPLVSGGQYRVTINLYGVTCPGANLTVNAYSNSTASDTGSIVYNFTAMSGIVYVINANVPNLTVTPASLYRYTTGHNPNIMCGLLPYQFPYPGEFTSQTVYVPGNLLPHQTYPNIYTNNTLSTKYYPSAQYDWGISITSGSPVSHVVTVQTDGTLNTWVDCP